MTNAEPTQSPDVVERRIALALHMIELGACVFPLASNSKKPLIPKERGGKGFLDASPDPAMARTFLSNAGQPNYGLAFPEGSDVFVLDLDGGDRTTRPGWREDWQRLYDRLGPPGLTYIVSTPSDGRHAYYRWRDDLYGPMPTGDEMLGWTVRKPWKGYLVGPGSIINGKTYEPAGASTIADFPEAWVRAALGEQTITIGGAKPLPEVGQRHAHLRNTARRLRGVIDDPKVLRAALMAENARLPEPKTEEEVDRAIGEVFEKFGPDDPEVVEERAAARLEDTLDLLGQPASGDFPEPPAPAAFGGLLGEMVEDLAGGTDASMVGLLGSVIAFTGALVPGKAYFHREQTSSPFIALVGESSIGRKGTAMTRVMDAMAEALERGTVNRVVIDGLNSGEGLVSTLYYKHEHFSADPVVGLVFEEEYASLLASRGREGSTLDPRMRQAFDGGPVSNRRSGETKTVNPPYWLPALIGITPVELRQRLEPGALQSGSANRWLYLPVTRREIIPTNTAPRFSPENRQAVVDANRYAVKQPPVLTVDPGVTTRLAEYADFLPGVSFGLARDLTRRLSIIAFRVALTHALVERSVVVSPTHLDRALALTEYARRGIAWVFGDTIGNPDANLLFRHLAASGYLTRTTITREIVRDPIRRQAAIDELLRIGRAQIVTVHTTGRARMELRPTEHDGAFGSFFQVLDNRTPETHENRGNVELSAQDVGNNVAESREEGGTKSEEVHMKNVGRRPDGTTWCYFMAEHRFDHRDTQAASWCSICSPAEAS